MSYSTPTASRSYLDHPVLQYDDQHGEIDPQHATLLRPVRTRGHCERIRDKIAASKKKGIWVGGVLPLGYRVLDRKLVVDEDEARTVRLIFDRYLSVGSMLVLTRELNERGIVHPQAKAEVWGHNRRHRQRITLASGRFAMIDDGLGSSSSLGGQRSSRGFGSRSRG